MAVGVRPAIVCPGCGASMLETQIEEVRVDECPRCQGVWLDRGELAVMLNRKKKAQRTARAPAAAAPGPARSSTRACPRCSRPMQGKPFAGTAVVLDVCLEHGVYLDRGELEQLADPAAAGATAAPRRDAPLELARAVRPKGTAVVRDQASDAAMLERTRQLAEKIRANPVDDTLYTVREPIVWDIVAALVRPNRRTGRRRRRGSTLRLLGDLFD